MKSSRKILLALIATSMLGAHALAQQLPTHPSGPSSSGGVEVELCDGVTRMEVKGLAPGHAMTHQQALAVTHSLMEEWERKHPGEHWQMAQGASPTASSAAPEASPEPKRAQVQQGDTYASFNQRDYKVWQANTDRFVQEGKEVFHSADKLGGTIGVSCDMCHPDAANTHPETYPKYQVQLQRVALLRDMIEWCIENPVKGKTMDPDDQRLRALEAYILAQRKGVPLDYGKH